MYPTTGYTPTIQVELPTKAQLLLLRDMQLEYGNKDIAAAVDNVIDMLERRAARITETAEMVTVVVNQATNGTVRMHPSYGGIRNLATPEQVKAQSDAICEEYEAKYVDVSKNFNGIKATATATWAERHLNGNG